MATTLAVSADGRFVAAVNRDEDYGIVYRVSDHRRLIGIGHGKAAALRRNRDAKRSRRKIHNIQRLISLRQIIDSQGIRQRSLSLGRGRSVQGLQRQAD